LIAQLVVRLNFRPLRGSSTHGGRDALAAIVADLAVNHFAAHASDGPTGPPGCREGRIDPDGRIIRRCDLPALYFLQPGLETEELGPFSYP